MSVDIKATLPAPIALDAVLATARETMAELLGLPSAPALTVFADRRYRQGRPVAEGHRLDGADLAAATLGRRPADLGFFEIEVDLTGDRAWLNVLDYADTDEPEDDSYPIEAVFSPYRTCVGVVTAASLALAVALRTGGDFVDDEIRMLEPAVSDPRAVIERTRLNSASPDDLAARAERYMRQFSRLSGWPRALD